MKKYLFLVLILLFSTNSYSAPPTRQFNYVPNTLIDPAQNNSNENALYSYLQVGVDTYAMGSITGDDISSVAAIAYSKLALTNSIVNNDISSSAAISQSKIESGKGILPSGAVYFMISGSCPSGTTDVSASYSNLFVRINATAGSTGGSDTHTHAAGSFGVSGTTGAVSQGAVNSSPPGTGVNIGDQERAQSATFSASVTGTSASGDNVPAYVTMKACQVS